MSKRSNWEYQIFLASPQKQPFPLTPDWLLPKQQRLDFGPDYGLNQQRQIPATFNPSPNSLRHTPLNMLNINNQFSKFDDFPLNSMMKGVELDEKMEDSYRIDKKIQFQENDSIDFEETPFKEQAHDSFRGGAAFKTVQRPDRMLQQSQQSHQNRRKGRAKEKGLRNLAGKSYQIMIELKKATYKEVAMKLLEEMEHSEQNLNKEESNIKRRVYDALNVLIAMNVLKKNRKLIIYDVEDQNALSSAIILKKKQQIQGLEDQIAFRTQVINKKHRLLKSLKQKRDKLDRLFKRNATNPELKTQSQIIDFPTSSICLQKWQSWQLKFSNKGITLENIKGDGFEIKQDFWSLIHHLYI